MKYINVPIGGGFTYNGVTEGGDSGGPITVTLNSVEAAIGPNNYCAGTFRSGGTSFKNTAFANALNNINGTTYHYVDREHPSTLSEGTIVRPYKTVIDGISGATNWETVSIAKGNYDETLTIDKPLKLVAPVGTVTIGNSAYAKIAANPNLGQTEETEHEKPKTVQLFQNYPNPFNPSTTIEFTVAELTSVSLKIYNTVGQEVVTLVNESKQPGNYSANFDASQFSSGVYFYVLRTGSRELIKQMTLIK